MSETTRAARDRRGTAATRWSEDQARPFVEAWRESGKSIEAFARDAGVGVWRLRYWAPRLEMREVARTRATKKAKQEQRIVPAVVKIGEPTRAPAIVVRLPDGVEVELHDVAQVDAGESSLEMISVHRFDETVTFPYGSVLPPLKPAPTAGDTAVSVHPAAAPSTRTPDAAHVERRVSRGERPVLRIRLADGRELRVTGEHPLWLPRVGAFRLARELDAGDRLLGRDGAEVRIAEVSAAGVSEVWELSVDAPDTYFADGILAHNY